MNELVITDADLATLKDKVVLITGGSSGIGFAAAQLSVGLGAKVVVGDVQEPKGGFSNPNIAFERTDVAKWIDLVALFKKAKDLHGRIDHVFANAGVSPKANYLSTDVDENGVLKEPEWLCQDVNLRGCINTVTLAVYHMRPDQQQIGGSIVITASIASFQHFRGADYASSKHGSLGFMRGMHALLVAEGLPIRVNAICPSWTTTGLVPAKIMTQLGVKVQAPEAAARSALILMADGARNGQLMHSAGGRFKEVEESIFIPAAFEVTGRDGPSEDEVMGQALALMGGQYTDKA